MLYYYCVYTQYQIVYTHVYTIDNNSITSLSNFSFLWDVALKNMAWLIVRTVLPINTSTGDFSLSLGWNLVLNKIRNRIINPSVPPSRFFCFEEG